MQKLILMLLVQVGLTLMGASGGGRSETGRGYLRRPAVRERTERCRECQAVYEADTRRAPGAQSACHRLRDREQDPCAGREWTSVSDFSRCGWMQG